MDIIERLRFSALAPHASEIAAVALPAAELVPRPDLEPPRRLGGSHFGGIADLPRDVRWPRARGRPLSLLAQIDLADVAALGIGGLPPAGTLSFFYDTVGRPWGDRVSERSGWRVLHVPAGASLRRRMPTGLTHEMMLPEVAMGLQRVVTYPSPFSDLAPECAYDEEDLYCELVLGDHRIRHQLLGHPEPIQSDPVSSGSISLLQLDSDPLLDTMWGDAGKLHFTISKAALARHDFTTAWLELQCY
jgi:uncharacterized protein YwqG